ncbi:unnamed protein product, partial [Ectocarpus fasciculatus]
MVDIRLDRDVIFHEVKARFDVAEGHYSFPCPTVEMKGGVSDAKAAFDDTKAGFGEVKAAVDELKGGFGEVRGEMKRGFDDTKAGFSDAKAGFDDLKKGFGEVQGEMKRGFGDTKADLDDVKNELVMVKETLDKVAESTQESLMRLKDLQAPHYPYPRLVAVKEVGSDRTSSNAHGVKRWLSKMRGTGKKDMTLHFLCPVDMTTVPCGYGGEGYRFRETRGWVKKIAPVLQVAVVTAKVALKATTGLEVDISDFLKDVKDGLIEELVDRALDEDALLRVISGEEDIGAGMQQDARASYE